MENTFTVDFENEVIEASNKQPILVDFWAEWCTPCQVLGPILDSLEKKASGKWKLVKINVDENKETAARYKVKSIPSIKIFYKEQITNEFNGLMYEAQFQKWLDENLPSELDEKFEEAIELQDIGDNDQAKAILEEILSINPEYTKANFSMGKLILLTNPQMAEDYLKKALKDPKFVNSVNDCLRITKVLNQDVNAFEDHQAKDTVRNALTLIKFGDFDYALKQLISVLEQHKDFEKSFVREACVAIFLYLGEQHDTTKKYRKLFDRALY